ncbi:MAG: serine/threonine-protein kinase [Deltaproteobacteria bacterium]|nr:serine/threonine-protein kinase [Deltaproteobacteria bacterium]
MADDADAHVAGELLGRFRLLRKLGAGSHGTVWEAEDPLLSERLALKVLHPWRMHEPDARERLKREVILARRIVHPGVCRIYDLHEADGTLFITMEFVDGRPLAALVKEGLLPLERAGAILRQLASAVAAAHAAGVVHRDLKPSNVHVNRNDDVIVLDFGIASAHDLGRLTQPGLAVGTLRFLAPETWRTGTSTAKSDQFALGVIGYIVLTQRMPFPHKDVASEMLAAMKQSATPITDLSPEVPVAVAAVVERAMAFAPEDRFADVAAFEAALTLALSSSAFETERARPERTSISSNPLDLSVPEASSGDVRLVSGATGSAVPAGVAAPEGFPVVAAAMAALAVVVVVAGVAIGIGLEEAPVVVVDAGVRVVQRVIPRAAVIERIDVVVDAGPARAPEVVDVVGSLLRGLQADARNLGLRPGDVPGWDQALAHAIAARRSPVDVAERQMKKSRAVLDGVVVDRAFVGSKLARFNAAADQAVMRVPALREKLRPYSKDIADKLSKGDARGANRAINAAWVVVDKTKR